MKLPVDVRAREGKKYRSPETGPATFHWRGSAECKSTMTSANTPATPAHAVPTRHLIRGPASRCRMNSHTTTKGLRTWIQ